MNILKSRKFRQGSFATILTIIVVAIIVVVNLAATILTDKYDLSLDLTADKRFGITEETKDFLNKIDKDIQVYILAPEDQLTAGDQYLFQANEVMQNYARESKHIQISYIDILRDPSFVSRYPEHQLSQGSILIESGDRTTVLSINDLFDIQQDYYGGQNISSKAEQAMTSAILNVTSDKKVTVSVISGHNEPSISGFTNLLEMNNYQVITQNLMTEDIAPEAKIAILAAPARDFTEEELKKLDAFLDNNGQFGKTAFYLASNEQPPLPNLEAFLADWGIQVQNGIVFETDQNRYLNLMPFMPIVDYGTAEFAQEIAKNAQQKQMIATVPFARPLEVVFESQNGISTTTLLEFSQTSGIRPVDAPQDWQPSPADASGPIPALAMGRQTRYEGTTPLTSTVLVSGSNMLIDQGLLSSTSIANSEYMLTLMDSLAQREDVIRIESKALASTPLGATSAQTVLLGAVFIAILPLGLLIFGIVVWMRRRHR